jgi:chemotaxis protein CheY-P-specific phosphatase CheC
MKTIEKISSSAAYAVGVGTAIVALAGLVVKAVDHVVNKIKIASEKRKLKRIRDRHSNDFK